LFGYNIYQHIIYLKRGRGLPGKNSLQKHMAHTMKLTNTTKASIFFYKNTDVFVGNLCHSLRVKAAPQPVEALEVLKRPHREMVAFIGFGKSPAISGNLRLVKLKDYSIWPGVLMVTLKLTASFIPGKLRGLEDDIFREGTEVEKQC